MFMDIIGIDLFDQNVNMVYTEVRLRCFWILHCTGIDLFDQNVEMACPEIRLRCLWISLVLIYLIKMWVWHALKLDSDVFRY